MATPYIPPEFRKNMTFGSPTVDAFRKKAAQTVLNAQRQNVKTRKAEVERAKKGKKKDAIAAAQKRLTQAYAAQQSAQNRVYETTGQYEKLLNGTSRDAYLSVKALFNQYGLGSLAGRIFDFVKNGYGPDTIGLLLQDTPEYKKRFAGNEARAKAGLPVLSPAEYLSTEASYRQILAQAGMPKGFYDNPADFQNWIAKDVSPTEIKTRVDGAIRMSAQADPATKRALMELYNVDELHVAAYFLDQKRALPLLEKQQAAALIGAAALRRGLAMSRTSFENYATAGISADQAEAGFAQISETLEPMQQIARRFGATWSQSEAEREVFQPGATTNWAPFGAESAVEKGKRLRSQERALFGGATGGARGGLAPAYRAT